MTTLTNSEKLKIKNQFARDLNDGEFTTRFKIKLVLNNLVIDSKTKTCEILFTYFDGADEYQETGYFVIASFGKKSRILAKSYEMNEEYENFHQFFMCWDDNECEENYEPAGI